ncbi:MAG: STY0301 family protein [Dissulfurispiraceae bacterium]
MKLVTYLCAVVLVLSGICSAADSVRCPDTIEVDQKALHPLPGWSVSYNSLPLQIEMVTFFNGPPQENASVVYDKESKTKGGWVATWNFPINDGSYWIRCSYRGTRAELSRRLPGSVSVCEVTYDDGSSFPSGLPVIRKIECR